MIEDWGKKPPPKDNKEVTAQFGKNLKTLRNKKGITRKTLAADLNMSEIAITSYEGGVRQPNLAILLNIANYFNVSLDELVGHYDTTREQRAIEKYRLENADALLSRVGKIVRTSPIAYALIVRRGGGQFVKDDDGNVKVVNEGDDAICFGGAWDLIQFAESIQDDATFSEKDFTTVFWEKAESLFTDVEAVKFGNEIMDYMKENIDKDKFIIKTGQEGRIERL